MLSECQMIIVVNGCSCCKYDKAKINPVRKVIYLSDEVVLTSRERASNLLALQYCWVRSLSFYSIMVVVTSNFTYSLLFYFSEKFMLLHIYVKIKSLLALENFRKALK